MQPETVRRRLRSRELAAAETIGAGEPLVRLRADDWLRVEDAAALLGVSTSTVRARIQRGALNAQRARGGRYRVQLRGLLEDPRCDPSAVELFTTGAEVPEPGEAEPAASPEHRLSRAVFVRLYEPELELLDRGRARHGSHRAAVVAGLYAIDAGDGQDVGELAAERDHFQAQAARSRSEHEALAARTEGRTVDELYCPGCERLVPIEELDHDEDGDEHWLLIHPHRGRLRRPSVVARRRAERSADAG